MPPTRYLPMLRAGRLGGIALVCCVALTASAAQQGMDPMAQGVTPLASIAEWAEGAQPFEGLGDFHRAVSTKSHEAQAYFDQGMRYLWAFNHDESTRSFAKATQEDPQCAMCYWGVALTVGPTYN